MPETRTKIQGQAHRCQGKATDNSKTELPQSARLGKKVNECLIPGIHDGSARLRSCTVPLEWTEFLVFLSRCGDLRSREPQIEDLQVAVGTPSPINISFFLCDDLCDLRVFAVQLSSGYPHRVPTASRRRSHSFWKAWRCLRPFSISCSIRSSTRVCSSR